MTFRKKNNGSNKKVPSIDLHGYTTDQVYDALDKFLLQASQSGSSQAKIMTGKGKGLVKKEAEKYLKHAGYPFQHEKLSNGKENEGVLIIFLN
ncbi:MAG: Smr/MutS family protein [Bdellovibrionales bacterium]|nr:Smr/MutS family protein [Bdellovibrionales bacterium]